MDVVLHVVYKPPREKTTMRRVINTNRHTLLTSINAIDMYLGKRYKSPSYTLDVSYRFCWVRKFISNNRLIKLDTSFNLLRSINTQAEAFNNKAYETSFFQFRIPYLDASYNHIHRMPKIKTISLNILGNRDILCPKTIESLLYFTHKRNTHRCKSLVNY